MIDTIYKTLLTILNKENQGYVSPTEFNLLANNVQQEIFRGYFDDYAHDKNRDNKGGLSQNYANLTFNQRQRIQQFASITPNIVVTTGTCTLPADLYFVEDNGVVTSSDQAFPASVVEEVERGQVNYLNKSIAKPSTLYPVYERYSSIIRIAPITVTKVDVRYLRKPKVPNWTYVMVANQPMYNPSDNTAQDFELHQSEFSNIVLRMLTYFGLNLREQEVINIAEALKDKSNLKENN